MSDEPPACDPDDVLSYFADVSSVSRDMPVDELRPILRRFIASITVHPTAIEFTCTFDAWLREHFPQLCSPHPFPPQGPDDPKGGGSSTPPVSPAPSSTPSNPAVQTTSSCTPSVSNSLIPCWRSNKFGDILFLITPYIVKRKPY